MRKILPIRLWPQVVRRWYQYRAGLAADVDWWLGPWPAPYDSVDPIDPADVRIAYQPGSAEGTDWERAIADLSASLVNLNDPGTNDGTAGAGLTVDAEGWVTNGSAYVDTGLRHTDPRDVLLASYSATGAGTVFGAGTVGGISVCELDSDFSLNAICNSDFLPPSDEVVYGAEGVIGWAYGDFWFNAILQTSITNGSDSPSQTMMLMAINSGVASVHLPSGSKMHSFFWGNNNITNAQIQAVSAAMRTIGGV